MGGLVIRLQGKRVLEVIGLSGGWGQTIINEGVSLHVGAGETVGLVGRNGVGKTTLLELITGRARWRAGSIKIAGIELAGAPTHHRSSAGLAYVPQNREMFSSLTVEEHLMVAQRPGRWTKAEILELFPSLGRRLRNLGGQLSGGEQQMLAIGRALVGNPKVLLMDEPSEGLSPLIVEVLVDVVKSLAAAGDFSILLVEQRLDIAFAISSRCLFMDRGKIIAEADSEDLRAGRHDIPKLMGLARVS